MRDFSQAATAPRAGASPGKPGHPSAWPGPRIIAASVQRSRASTAMPVPSNAWPRALSARATAAAPWTHSTSSTGDAPSSSCSFRRQRAVLARAQHAAVRRLLAAEVRSSVPAAAGNHRAPLTATRAPHTHHVPPNGAYAGVHRLTPFHRASSASDPPSPAIAWPPRALRRHRLVFHAAAREVLRRTRSAPRHVASRARSEISVAFAHRWAAIRTMPPEERAAAAAALRSEEEAALVARTTHLLEEVKHEALADSAQRRARFAAGRALRLERRREISGATAIPAPRRPRPSTPARAPPRFTRA